MAKEKNKIDIQLAKQVVNRQKKKELQQKQNGQIGNQREMKWNGMKQMEHNKKIKRSHREGRCTSQTPRSSFQDS